MLKQDVDIENEWLFSLESWTRLSRLYKCLWALDFDRASNTSLGSRPPTKQSLNALMPWNTIGYFDAMKNTMHRELILLTMLVPGALWISRHGLASCDFGEPTSFITIESDNVRVVLLLDHRFGHAEMRRTDLGDRSWVADMAIRCMGQWECGRTKHFWTENQKPRAKPTLNQPN